MSMKEVVIEHKRKNNADKKKIREKNNNLQRNDDYIKMKPE